MNAVVTGLPAAARSLDAVEMEWKQRIFTRLLTVLDLSMMATVPEAQARLQIRDTTMRLLVDESAPLSLAQRQLVAKQVEDEVLGLGPLEPLLADPAVADILVNGPNKVFVERFGKLELTAVRFHDNAHLMNIIDRIVSGVGRRVDESSPMVDARLKDGSRVNVIIPPLALDGATMSIRRFAVEKLTIDDLVRYGSITSAAAATLNAAVKLRQNIVISGGTGAGKTTLLNILSGFIPADERIVTIEDSAELQLRQPHVVRLETRPPNIEGRGEVSQRELVRNSLRMRPDRIVIGEVRGGEALDMLQAMNTGHDGSLTTVHANTPRDALGRIETMVSMTGINFPIKALRAQMASAVNLVIQATRHEDGKRRVTSISEINGMEGDVITMSDIFTFVRHGMNADGSVNGEMVPTGTVPSFHKLLDSRGIDLPISVFKPAGRSR